MAAPSSPSSPRKGRGAGFNPDNRFFPLRTERCDDGWQTEHDPLPPLATTVTVQHSRTVIARNSSPDIPFSMSINPYQGCEHGCVYCFARPTHAYLDLSPGLDFETRLFAKPDAARLLREELSRPGHVPSTINLGSNTDPYQPVEREWQITRSLLEVMRETRHPVAIVTKNALVLRDLDLLSELARQGLTQVFVSVTTLDGDLSRTLEPRASAPHRRLAAIERLARAGIPVGVMVAPLIPFLNDAELEAILEQAANAGAQRAGYILIRLPHEVKDLFRDWLRTHVPLKAERIMAAIREARGGKEYDARFGTRMTGEGVLAELLRQRFHVAVRRFGLNAARGEGLRTDLFRPPRNDGQLSLFD